MFAIDPRVLAFLALVILVILIVWFFVWPAVQIMLNTAVTFGNF